MADIRQIVAKNKIIQLFSSKYNSITAYMNFPTEHSKYSFIVFLIASLAAFFISVNARYISAKSILWTLQLMQGMTSLMYGKKIKSSSFMKIPL